METLIYVVEDDEGIRELYDGAFEGVFIGGTDKSQRS